MPERQAWISGGVLLFRGAGTSVDAHLRLSRVFGELEASATRAYNAEGNPYLLEILQDPAKPPYDGTLYEVDGEPVHGFIPWHWDQSFMPTIVRGAVLRMIQPAPRGGLTGFIDGVAAYERLPAGLRRRIDDLEVVYSFTSTAEKFHQFPPTVHPLVITQRETGRKVLKYSPLHSRRILGMGEDESRHLLTEIAEHITDERYAYFHEWGVNDMIVWDNWRVLHSVRGAPPEVRRYGQRTTIAGDYDVGRYLDPKLDKRQGVVTYAD